MGHVSARARLVRVLCCLSLLLPGASHTGTRGRPAAWQVVGQTGGPTRAIAVQGTYAYLGVGLRLVVLDVSDPAQPHEVGVSAPLPHYVEHVAISGTLAYVAAGGGGLQVVSVADPAHPALVGGLDTLGYAEDVAVSGHVAYLADGPYGLRVLDVSDPAHPAEIGSAYTMRYAYAVAVSGHLAYLAAAGAGLAVADVSDPAHPVELGELDTPGYAYGIAVSGGTAYVAGGWAGLRIVSVADPGAPVEVGSCATPGWAFGVTVSGTLAYVAGAFAGLQVVDVSDPAGPTPLGGSPAADGHAGEVVVRGTAAYVADDNLGLRVLDVSDPWNPSALGSYSPPAFAYGVDVAGTYAYVAAGLQGLRIVDVADPYHPREAGAYDTGSSAVAVDVAGQYAYLCVGAPPFYDTGLHVVDVADPAHPQPVAVLPAFVECQDLVVNGSIVYVASAGELRLIDVSDPYHPAELSHLSTAEPGVILSGASSLAVSGTLAYAANVMSGMAVVDVSDPRTPVIVASYNQGFNVMGDVALSGARAYLTNNFDFTALDVSNPLSPTLLGSVVTPGDACDVSAAGPMAYVADCGRGVTAVDVSDPLSMTVAWNAGTPGVAMQAVREGAFVYVADGPAGLVILGAGSGGSHEQRAGIGIQGNSAARAGEPLQTGSTRSPALLAALARPVHRTEYSRLVVPPGGLPAPQGRAAGAAAHTQPSTVRAACVVTSTADSGVGTLRQCLMTVGADSLIAFDAAVFPPAHPVTITVNTELPQLSQGGLTLDGADHWVVLDGSQTPAGTVGLVIVSNGNTIQGLQVVGFPASGIYIGNGTGNRIGGDRAQGSGPLGRGNLASGNGDAGISLGGSGVMSNTVLGNLVGTDVSGARSYANGTGITIGGGARYNVVGSLAAGERNVVAGNADSEITLNGTGTEHNQFIGNFVGTDATGTFALHTAGGSVPWLTGVFMHSGASYNVIGPGNVIGGAWMGIEIVTPEAAGNVVTGNFIGTALDGLAPIGNFGDGIVLGNGTHGNMVGPDNRVAYNAGSGVAVYGPATLENTITANAIYANEQQGIVLSEGGNGALAAPIFAGVTITRAAGTALPGATVELFSDRGDEGQVYEGSTSAGPSGAFTFTRPAGFTGPHLTATATDLAGNTSEFSEPYVLITVTLVVTSPLDSGPGTLRQILQDAQRGDAITFDPAVFPPSAPVTIAPASALPALVRGRLTLDGSNAGVILDGSATPPGTDGLLLASDGNRIQGLQIVRFPGSGIAVYGDDNVIGGDRGLGQGNVVSGNGGAGIAISFASRNTVVGNFVGTDASGTHAFGNASLGIFISPAAFDNRIGGPAAADRNLVSGNGGNGISLMLGSHGNLIAGNYVGVDVSGVQALGNYGHGISMELGSFDNRIEGNLTSGNARFGVCISDWGSDYNVVAGNRIGTDASGTQAIPNDSGGVYVLGAFNRIGGAEPGDRNLVSGNAGNGITIVGAFSRGDLVLGNYIGTDAGGTQALGSSTSGVAIGVGARALVGGATPAEGNVIGGHGWYGVSVTSDYNAVIGNAVGVDTGGTVELGNLGGGIRVAQGEHNILQGNRIAHNLYGDPTAVGAGVLIDGYPFNTVRQNAVYANTGPGILLANGGNDLLPAPVITRVAATSVAGTTCPRCLVEIYSDDAEEGRLFEGSATADAAGAFLFMKGAPLSGPFVTATATDAHGNTSAFSSAAVRHWVYLPLAMRNAPGLKTFYAQSP